MEVGIEYLRRTNTSVGKMMVPYQVSVYLLNGEFQKKALVSMFKRTENHSLSVMKQVSLCFFVFTCLLSFLARGWLIHFFCVRFFFYADLIPCFGRGSKGK
jgi:hypothetical protein